MSDQVAIIQSRTKIEGEDGSIASVISPLSPPKMYNLNLFLRKRQTNSQVGPSDKELAGQCRRHRRHGFNP